MRKLFAVGATSLLAVMLLAGCSSPGEGTADTQTDPSAMLVTQREADAHGGWIVTPDSGPVDGDTTDCTGAPYDWPDLEIVAHASQFLSAADEKNDIAVVVKKFDHKAAVNIKALRGALAPCKPASGPVQLHGAMIRPVDDDSFAYQTQSEDSTGKFVQDDMVIACGSYELEAIWISHSQTVDQRQLEQLLGGAVKRMSAAGHCNS